MPNGFLEDFASEEDYLKWEIAEIHRAAHKAAEPFVRRLVEIEASKPPPPLIYTRDMSTEAEKRWTSWGKLPGRHDSA